MDEAIAKYTDLSKIIFTAKSKSSTALLDHEVLERAFKQVIRDSPLKLPCDALLEHPEGCKTFVLSVRTRGSGSNASIMRSYSTDAVDAFPAQIWEAARATSAAPTFFEPIVINGVKYGDGGTGWNNPTAEAIAEAHNIWPGRAIGCLLSIGTGLEAAIQLGDGTEEITEGFVRSLFQRFLPRSSFRVDVAKYCVASLTSCEKTHQEVSRRFADRVVPNVNYFRLNVPQGMSRIGFEEWKKLGDIVALTEDYMDYGEMSLQKNKIAERILDTAREPLS